jgi:hypothetical protein
MHALSLDALCSQIKNDCNNGENGVGLRTSGCCADSGTSDSDVTWLHQLQQPSRAQGQSPTVSQQVTNIHQSVLITWVLITWKAGLQDTITGNPWSTNQQRHDVQILNIPC